MSVSFWGLMAWVENSLPKYRFALVWKTILRACFVCIANDTHVIESANGACHFSPPCECEDSVGAEPHNSIRSMFSPKSSPLLYTRACKSPMTQTH